ncbi:PepSY domain-containing protein [Rothia santali]|uniref:PepSY domain-containing protein n=1 Tax=Rothia santali TaxID=2949643 RepID=UPI0035A16ED0
MFVDPATAEPSTSEAVFVDPVTGEIRGDLAVYGTSGSLPLRTWIDGLHLGDTGRLYSELAASWLWVVALGGLVLCPPANLSAEGAEGPTPGTAGGVHPKAPKPALPRAPWWAWLAVGIPAVLVGLFIPLFGITLAGFW